MTVPSPTLVVHFSYIENYFQQYFFSKSIRLRLHIFQSLTMTFGSSDLRSEHIFTPSDNIVQKILSNNVQYFSVEINMERISLIFNIFHPLQMFLQLCC